MIHSLLANKIRFIRLLAGDFKGGTESEVIAAQDQTLQTKYQATKILQSATDQICGICKKFDETLEHAVSAKQIVAKE